jgi:hypothetical protein
VIDGDVGLLTFVVPCSGRPTLLTLTIPSFARQRSRRWRALLAIDGLSSANIELLGKLAPIAAAEPRLRVWPLHHKAGSSWKKGKGTAGHVRNLCFPWVITPWVGFVDDDDSASPLYVSWVEAALAQSSSKPLDSIVFRMRWVPWQPNERPFCVGTACSRHRNSTLSEVLPEWNATMLRFGSTGISFCIRTELTRGANHVGFRQSSDEDYRMHQHLFRMHKHTLLLPYVGYYVRGVPRPEPVAGLRLENPAVCTTCKRSEPEAASDEFALARWLAHEEGGRYEDHRRKLLGHEPRVG